MNDYRKPITMFGCVNYTATDKDSRIIHTRATRLPEWRASILAHVKYSAILARQHATLESFTEDLCAAKEQSLSAEEVFIQAAYQIIDDVLEEHDDENRH